jgi:uncharacterized protein (DUF1697 family)
MSIYVALLRAVNVSGKNIIKMAELKQLFEAMRFAKVQTYIQSGNVLFESDAEPVTLRQRIEDAIQKAFGLEVTVVLRTLTELEAVIADCPFADVEQLYVSFLAGAPSPDGIERLRAFPCESEEWQIRGQAVYILYRAGAGQSKLTNAVIEKRLGVASTARNWRTTLKLVELAKSLT